ncbi:Hypothetical_protein [Hexamita inflata]|uniref:Hypothetical_protein n=1 Tax=Hexamita inflata TaxID=28002 RepID=A0AA86Q1S4_9EUKA|nr:Hypothetical protein HINF_LOCUS36701 [Hexamita inflata]
MDKQSNTTVLQYLIKVKQQQVKNENVPRLVRQDLQKAKMKTENVYKNDRIYSITKDIPLDTPSPDQYKPLNIPDGAIDIKFNKYKRPASEIDLLTKQNAFKLPPNTYNPIVAEEGKVPPEFCASERITIIEAQRQKALEQKYLSPASYSPQSSKMSKDMRINMYPKKARNKKLNIYDMHVSPSSYKVKNSYASSGTKRIEVYK